MNQFYKIIKTPVGPLTLIANDNALTNVEFGKAPCGTLDAKNKILIEAEKQLKKYFSGELKDFDLPLDPQGTEFQKRAWSELRKIPYGQVISYGEQAKRAHKPQAMRAIGSANGKNPFAIIVPCHRVIAKNGKLGGYACGLSIKRKLLKLEGVEI
jgi:methylated-DNA-[protein]-cysteine S-methyltransferase